MPGVAATSCINAQNVVLRRLEPAVTGALIEWVEVEEEEALEAAVAEQNVWRGRGGQSCCAV